MKRTLILLPALVLTIAAGAQTLNVQVGNVVYRFPAAQTGEMTFTDGTQLTVMGRTFTLADIAGMTVDDTEVADNLVSVEYSQTAAKVYVAGNVAQYVEPTVSGAHVTISQTNSDAVDGDEIVYQLSGTASDGSLTLAGTYRCTVSLAGVSLTNPSGAAITISNSKRIQLSAKQGTENTLADCADGSQKACIYSKGQLQLQGNGTLNVSGNTKHAIKSASYISVKNLTLNITSAASDGISCEEYFQMKSGSVTISSVGGDGIQCDLDGTTSTGETDSHSNEDSGNIYIEGGTLNVTVPKTNTAGKCVKSDGDIQLTGGTLTLNAYGDIDLTDTTDPSYTTGIKADGSVVLQGAEATVSVTGAAGRGVAAETFTAKSGSLTVTNSGATKSSGTTYYCTAKGIKATTVDLQGGTLNITTSGAASKGIKSDNGSMTVSGGTIGVTVSGAGAYDGTERDAKGCAALKSDVDMTISGGTLTLNATNTGGKCIKVDGKLLVSDGTVTATSKGSQYKYSNSVTSSAKGIKSTGAMTISGGTLTATSSTHEAIESKSTLTIEGGIVTATGGDDALNSTSDMYLKGGTILGRSTGSSTGADGFDANGNMYVQGATVFGIAHGSPDVAFDANTEGGKKLYVQSGTLVGISGLESGASLTQSCYQASSYSKGAWYGLYSNGTLVLAFQVPSSGTMGSPMVVSASGTTTLKSGISVSAGTKIWDGLGYLDATASGGTSVTLSSYSSGGGGGGGGHGGGGGGRW